MGFFSDLMGWMPGIGEAVDMVEGWIGIDDTSKTNRNNMAIAEKNLDMQRETNANNLQIARESNENQANIARQYNANQVQLQNDMNAFNKEMWDLNNEYNSPARQLERARAAGINPNIVFGQPVAATPVQQTAIPNQSMPSYNTPKLDAPQLNMKYEKSLRKLGDLFRGLGKIPFIQQQLQGQKEDVKRKKLENQILEFAKREKEDEQRRFENFGVFKSDDGSMISPDEYLRLTDEQKKKYLSPLGYKHKISGKVLSLDDFKSMVPESQKDMYDLHYGDLGNRLPELVKSGFHSRADYENWKSLYSFANTLNNIDADSLQNLIRKKVAEGQLEHNDVTNALIHMPKVTFDKMVKDTERTIQEIKRIMTENEGLAKRLENKDLIDQYTADKLKNELDTDAVTLIKQNVPEGNLRSFFLGFLAIVKQIAAVK